MQKRSMDADARIFQANLRRFDKSKLGFGKRSRSKSIGVNNNRPSKKIRRTCNIPSASRSSIITRSRSRSIALLQEQSADLGESSMDSASPATEDNLKRKHSANQEPKAATGESSKEGTVKKQKPSPKGKSEKISMSNIPPQGKNKYGKTNESSSAIFDAKDSNPNVKNEAPEDVDPIKKAGTSGESTAKSNSKKKDKPLPLYVDLTDYKTNNESNESFINSRQAALLSSTLLSQAGSSQALPHFSYNNENEMSIEARIQKYDILRNISERKLITKSELQKSLLSAMQRTRSCQSGNRTADNQSDNKPSASGYSDFRNVLKIKIEKDDDVEQCKYAKDCLADDSSIQTSVFKSPPANSNTTNGNAFHNVAIKQEVGISNSEEMPSPFFTRRMLIAENMDADPASGLNIASNSSANNAEGIDGEIGRLQALMDSRRIPLSLFGALESRMQQLFHKSMGSATSSRAQQLLQQLQAAEDDEHQLQVLVEMSQLLVMGNEDTLVGFPVKQLVPILINLLLKEYNFELMNQACRALTYLMEALPRSSAVIVEAIPVLLNKVQVIQCIDVAEQALTALKMLSKWHSKAILQAKGISACLMYLEFFSINAQRTALTIISNCCQNMLPHEFLLVQESLPQLSGWLTRQDEKSVESICLAFSGLVECFQTDSACLMQIGSQNLLSNIQQLLIISPPIISSQIFTSVIHMLALMCASCSDIAVFLLKQNFSETLHYLLVGTQDSTKPIELVSRSPHEYLELSYLISEIMPCLPTDLLFSIDTLIIEARHKFSPHSSVIWQWKDELGYWHSHEKNDSKNMEEAYQRGAVKLYISDRASVNVDLQSMEQFDDEGSSTSRPIRRLVSTSYDSHIKVNRADFYRENAELIYSSIKILFPVLFEMYCSSAGTSVKQKCLKAMLRMIFFAPTDVLQMVLKSQSISRQIASMLASQEFRFVVIALQMAEMLMLKLPAEFRVHFIREGVLHEVKILAKIDVKSWQIEMPVESNNSASSSSSSQGASGSSSENEPKIELQSNSSQAVFPVFSSATSTPVTLKEDDSSGSNVASKIRDAIKKRYMNIKRTFSSTDKEASALCCSDVNITLDSRVKINTWIRDQAVKFDNRYFNNDLISSHPVINVLNNLTNAVKALEEVDGCGLKPLILIRDVVTKNDISSFELIHSGLVKKLKHYLSAPQNFEKNARTVHLEDRLRTFLNVFMGAPRSMNEAVPEYLDSSPLIYLVKKLNACVSHLEQFPVKVYDQPSNGNTGRPGASIMKFFNMHQLKCIFQRHPDCTSIRQWRSGPVMIDPLASVSNVDRYLVSQGYGTMKEDDESESDLSYDDSSDDDGGLIIADIRMDHGHGTPKLQFLIGKNILPYNMTLYQAVRQYGSGESQGSTSQQNDNEYPVGYAAVWLRTHTILYRPVPPEEVNEHVSNESLITQALSAKKKHSSSRSSHASKNSSDKNKLTKSKKDSVYDSGIVPEVVFPSTYVSKLAGFDAVKDPSLEVIHLLRVIHGLSYHWGLLYQKNSWSPIVPQNVFINNELTLKVNRQLQDPLAIMTGNVPSWLSHVAYNFPFLFPFDTRHLLFYITSFDRERALQRLIDTAPESANTEKMTPRLEKRKRTVSRNNILKQAEIILQDHGDSKALLEIQYKNEVGTGLGPTLEFYALVSKELQRADLEMWHIVNTTIDDTKEVPINYVHNPSGLFPMPLSRNTRGNTLLKVCNRFKLLGKFLAKSIMDSRLVDIPLSLAFYKWMLNQESYLSLGDMQHVDETLAQNIIKLGNVVCEKKNVENNKGLDVDSLKNALDTITLDGCPIEDLHLDFTLPGYARVELKRGGKAIPVSIHNLEDYLKLLKYWTLTEGVARQMKSFKEGFESVVSLNRLQVFYPDELAYLFCGSAHSQWDMKTLMESCRPDHGYTLESQAIRFLFEILCNYTPEQQRQFVQFVTGSPRLPIGGLKSLSPPLTVVRKLSDDDVHSDHYLPSVMTCVNYLKLPDYTCIEVMREKLQVAISEGQHSFHLS